MLLRRTIYIFLFLSLVLNGCYKENWYAGSDAKLHFSVDTLMFDTVFTDIGTVTREFKVYNRSKKDLMIASVTIAGASTSGFRFNVDGRSGDGNGVKDVPILAGDSLFIFVEATIDPTNSAMPMVINDSVVFSLNSSIQDVNLVAYGQDVYLHNGEILESSVWMADKPHLIYNSVLIDTLKTLVLEPGVKVYSHRGSTIYIAGNLVVNGTVEEPVIFTGDRLNEMYSDIPGQWQGMYFLNGSTGNVIRNARIYNAVSGIHMGNLYTEDSAPDIVLENTVISHMTVAGLSTLGGSVSAVNCEFSDCGYFTTMLNMGGSYEFNHCTFANYYGWSARTMPSVYVSDLYAYTDEEIFVSDLEKAYFGNCIIYGSRDSEILLNDHPDMGEFNCLFEHCLVKADPETVPVDEASIFLDPFLNEDPMFKDIYESDFSLDTLAFAQDKANPGIAGSFPLDILGNDRFVDEGPDLGAYERVDTIPAR